MTFKVVIKPSGCEFEVGQNISILDGALAANKTIPYSCKDGSCGTCKSLLIQGDVCDSTECIGLSNEEVNAGYILTCRAKLTSDVVIQSEYLSELDGILELILPCKVNSIEFPSQDFSVLKLRLPPQSKFNYLAGQYIDLMYKGVRRSYSIANSYRESSEIELHIRRVLGGKFSDLIFNDIKVGSLLRLNGPLGTFFVRESEKPILFLAGGTGFAPVKAMVEDLLVKNSNREIHIYWGCLKKDHFYSEIPMEWQSNYKNIFFVPVLSGDSESWQGESGMVHDIAMNNIDNLKDYQVYACGSPAMIDVAKKEFLSEGLPELQFYSDAFTASKL